MDVCPGCCGSIEGHLTGTGVQLERMWERIPLGPPLVLRLAKQGCLEAGSKEEETHHHLQH